MFNFIYRNIYQPSAILALRIILWGFDWIMPEDVVEEAYEVISKYYGHQYRLAERTANIINHLELDQQEVVFNMAWELRKCERSVNRCVDAAQPMALPLQSQSPSQPPE
jgi:hypothetical protein